jgi:hypothetical protein
MPNIDNLKAATTAGDLGAALRLVDNLPPKEAHDLMLYAGFSVIGPHHKKNFWLHIQKSLSQACAVEVDGFGLEKHVALPSNRILTKQDCAA